VTPADPDALVTRVALLPERPGVYLWKDAAGTVLYVGKAKRLRSRVRSYLALDPAASLKTRGLMRAARDVETIVVPTEAHALILEANLIKEHRPRFNIVLRDDKSYPYIKVTVQEPFPRVYVTRRVRDDGARYFGPFTDVGQMRRSLDIVKRIFTVRSCRWNLPTETPDRPCLDYFIRRCKAPCVGHQDVADYRGMIDEVLVFLDGKPAEVVKRVRERMLQASERLDFERAASLRDALVHLERMEEPTVVQALDGGDRDVIGYARDGDDACVAVLRIRSGKLLAREHRYLEHLEEEPDDAVLFAYLAGSYLAAPERGSEVLLPFDVPDRELLQGSLAGTRIAVPLRGSKRELLDLAEQNARHLLEELKLAADEADERAADPVYDLAREVGLQRIPRSLVCFDNSTAQGRDTVGSVVWFENGRPKRGEYRVMRVKSADPMAGPDDFAAMREVVGRYFARRVEEHRPLPDLVVVDGGKGQLSAAHEALTGVGLPDLPLLALAKRDEEIHVRGRAEPLRLSRRSPALRLLQQARDEAHRTAVGYNRKRREIRTLSSELLQIPGVGPARRRALLAAFGSLQGVKEASAEQIAAVPGFSAASAAKVVAALRGDPPREPPAAE
jgi:excinuclease ABC subunit C